PGARGVPHQPVRRRRSTCAKSGAAASPSPSRKRLEEKRGTMTQVRRPLIAGNWKMNGLAATGLALARDIATRRDAGDPGCDIVLCPPATLVRAVGEAVSDSAVAVGGQDCHPA